MTEGARYWCEFCRDHFDSDHYESNPDQLLQHKKGIEYGPYGALLAYANLNAGEIEELRYAVRELSRVTAAGFNRISETIVATLSESFGHFTVITEILNRVGTGEKHD